MVEEQSEKRYYNLKIGSKKFMGGVIEVDPSAGLEGRLSDFYERDSQPYHFEHKESRPTGEVYALRYDEVEYKRMTGKDALGGPIGVPVPVKKGKPLVLSVEVTKDGKLRLLAQPKGIEVYLLEISRRRAENLRESAWCWAMQRAYIFE